MSPPRADAARNRQRLLDVALRELSRDGDVPLDRVAREAGVGIGTLYRHFGTREALTEAVYREELERLCAGAVKLLDGHPADVALRTWMDRYADFVATKRGMSAALQAIMRSGAISSVRTREHLAAAVGPLLEAGAREGVLRDDARASDVVASLAGVLMAAHDPDPDEQRAQVGRMLDLLVDGLRPPARAT